MNFGIIFVKPKYGERAKCSYMDTDSFIVHVKINDIYKDIADDVEIRFDTSNFELDRQSPKGENKKVTRLMKDELGGQIMKEFVGLRAETYNYLKDNIGEDKKKAKVTEKCVIKIKLKFEDYKNCLEALKLAMK